MSDRYKIIAAAKEDERVLVAEILNDQQKKSILQLELKRLHEPIPVINESLEEAFNKEEVMLIIADKQGEDIPIENLVPTLTLETDTGKIIGEEIYDPEELEMLKNDPEVVFLSEYFVTYPNMAIPGEKQFFVVSELYNELTSEEKMKECVSSMIISAPSTDADHYIKNYYNISYNEKIVTLIVGFDI